MSNRFALNLSSIVLSIGLLCTYPILASAKGDTAKEKEIRKLLEVTGSGKLGMQVLQQFVQQFKTAFPNAPEKYWNTFVKKAHPNELIDLIVPIYDQYFTTHEIQALIKFYQTPIGKKFVSLLPKITQASMQAGQEWGRKLGRMAMEDLKKNDKGKRKKTPKPVKD